MKKCICIIITLSLVISSISAAYAVDLSTPSAIKLDNSNISLMAVGNISDTRANGDSVAPVSSVGTSYYYNGTSSTSSNSFTINSWGMLVNAFTRSISETGKSLGTILGTTGTNTVNAINDVWTRLGITNGYIDDVENQLNLIRTYTVSVANNTSDSASDVSSILSAINNGLNIDIGSSFDWPWGMYNYFIDHPSVTLVRINENGTRFTQSVYTKSQGWFGNMMYFLIEHGRNVANALPLIVADVKNGNNTDVLTNSDLTTTSLEHDSLWDDINHIGANISGHLARLAYVLASDEEIAARQAAADNQTAVVNNFVNSSGSGSASTSDFSDMAGISSGVQDTLTTGVNPSAAFSSVSSDSSAWEWFTNDTKNALDTTNSNSRLLKYNYSNTPYLDDYYSDLQEKLGGYRK